jgi:hypothetical protein
VTTPELTSTEVPNDDDLGWTEADEDAAILRLASARNPDLAFFPGDDSGYDRDYPDPRDY